MVRKAVKAVAVSLFFLIAVLVAALVVAALFNGRTYVATDLRDSLLLAQPVAPLAREVVLKVVTFNIQDLYIAGQNRVARMRAIGERLLDLDPDLVGIQESFIEKDRATLLSVLSGSRLTHHQYYRSGTVGCGLLVLSAFPIVETFFHRYAENGKWYKPYHGDWWAGKGVALARIALPQGILDFYNTHAHAAYGSPQYDGVRQFQMGALAEFMGRSRIGAAPALLVGDMNCRPGSTQYETVVEGAGLQRLMNIESRIDHIFGMQCGHYDFEVLDTQPIEGTVPGTPKPTRLSDHTGYISTIRIRPTGAAIAATTASLAARPPMSLTAEPLPVSN